MNKLMILSLTCAVLLAGCETYGYGDENGYRDENSGWGYYDHGYSDRYGSYDWNRPDPTYGSYYADRYYRDDQRYREHYLSRDERIYRGHDGRYYCRRSDGTTGLIVGAIA